MISDEKWAEYLRFRDAFREMLDESFYPISWLDGEIAQGRVVLLCQEDSAILISVKVYPSGVKELVGEAATGKREMIISTLIPLAEQFGREIGCAFANISSRQGWDRVMREHGYSRHQTTIRKAL